MQRPEGESDQEPNRPEGEPPPTTTTRSGRQTTPPERLTTTQLGFEAVADDENEIFAFTAEMQEQALRELEYENPLLAFAASADPDTMYWHEAMREPDRAKFIEAAEKEIDDHFNNGDFVIVRKDQVPKGVAVMKAVWQMKRKRHIHNREVYKWKARLNIDGSKQIKGVNYWDTHSPVAAWPTIRMVLAMALKEGWETRQIDYVLAFCQAEAETDNLFMEIPKGFEVDDGDTRDYVLHLKRNLYGQKQASRIWFLHLKDKLESIGFVQSENDECLFTRGSCIYVLYTDDSVLTGPDPKELDQVIKDLKNIGLNLTSEGDMGDFLGVKIEKQEDGKCHLSQPHLIDQILKELHLDGPNVKTKGTPAPVGKVVHKFKGSKPFDNHFDYRKVVGKLIYLERCTRSDITHAVHVLARHTSDPKEEHGELAKWLGRYLKGTRTQGTIYNPNSDTFDCFVDANFAGDWDKEAAAADPDDSYFAKSRTGYVIRYAGCPIIWASKLQSVIALSSTEAEVIALSSATREIIPLIRLLRELKRKGFPTGNMRPTVRCKIFEDNMGAIEIAKVPKIRPRTKHMATQIFHFRHHFDCADLTIEKIESENQAADHLTKAISRELIKRHRKTIQGWDDYHPDDDKERYSRPKNKGKNDGQ